MTYVDAACAPLRKTGQIKIHGADAFEGMRKAGRLAAECLDMLVAEIKPGVTTERIDRLVYEFGSDHGALPATLMYRGYRKSTCTSINHVVCHGIPGDKPLREGDIVNVDVTLILDGWHGDSSRMYAVGEIPRRAERLIEVTYEGMMRGIAAIKPGATTGDIGHAIQTYRRSPAHERGARFLRPRPRAGCSTTSRTSSMSAGRARASCSSPACSSPSSR